MASILKYFGTNYQVAGPLKSMPFEWFSPAPSIAPNKRMRAINSNNGRITLKQKIRIATATLILLFVQSIHSGLDKNSNKNESVINGMLLAMLITCTLFLNLCPIKAQEIATFINGLLQFDEMYPKIQNKLNKMSATEILSIMFVKSYKLTQYLVPIGAVFGLHWSNPWKASLAGYWLIPKQCNFECGFGTQIYVYVIQFTVLAFNFWFLVFVMTAGIVTTALIQNLCIFSLIRNIET